MTWLEGWGKRRKLIIDGSKVTEGLANYPLCFLISSGTGMNHADLTDVFTELAYSVDDDFIGIDGAAPDPEKWKYEGNSTNAKIYSNKLRLWCTAGSSQDVNPTSLYELSGDFDIQVDYDLTTYPSTTNWYFGMQIVLDGSNYIVIYREYVGAQRYRCATNVAGSAGSDQSSTSDTSGKLRITRVGTTVTGYYWNGSSWTSLRSVSGFSTTSIPLRLRLLNDTSNPACEGNFDNLTVSGSVYWRTASHPNSRKIAFTDIYDNQCYTEIEKFDEALQSACLWVRIPAVTPTTDTELYFYYDKDHADNLTYVGNIGDTVSRNVWDDNFVAVYHLAQRPTTGSYTVFDSSKSMNNLQPNSTEAYTDLIDGMCGKAIQFDGGEYLEAVDAGSLDITTTSTMEALIYPTTTELVDEVICKAGSDATGYQFRADSGAPAFNFGASTVGEGTLWTNRWSYYAGTNNAAGQKRYFRDGQLVSSGTGATTPTNANTLRIGARWDGYYFNGTMDEIRISNIDRSPAYCTLNYYNMWDNLITVSGVEDDPPPPEPEPTWLEGWSKRIKLTVDGTKVEDNLASFPLLVVLSSGTGRTNADVTDIFDELSPDDGAFTDAQHTKLLLHMDDDGLTDSSPTSYAVTKNGDVTRSATESKFGGYSAYFDGTGDYLVLSGDIVASYMWGPSTIDCWVYFDTLTGGTSYHGNPIFCNPTNGGNSDQYFSVYTNGSVGYYRGSSLGSLSFATATGVVTTGQWYHIALVVGGSYWRIFVNGIKEAEISDSTYWYNGNEPVSIGREYIPSYSSYVGYYKGYIDELRVTNTAIWTSDFTPPSRAYTFGSENAKKIAVTSSDCVTQQYVEIEWWDAINKKAYFWTKAPTLASGVNTELYLYYDKNQSNNTTYVGNPTEIPAIQVWSDHYSAVWHMSQDPTLGSTSIKDSTNRGLHGSPNGSMNYTDLISGKVGNCLDFDGSDDYLSLANSAYLSPGTGNFTVSAWFKTSKNYSGNSGFVYSDYGTDQDNAVQFAVQGTSSNKFSGIYRDADADALTGVSSSTVNNGVFHHAYFVRTSQTTAKLYIDGLQVDDVSNSNIGSVAVSDGATPRIGDLSSYGGYYFLGSIDELRIAQVERSAGYVKADFYSCTNDLLSFSATENESRFHFSGTVAAKGSPVERLVLAYRRDTGALVGSATSVSGTGAFDLYTTYSGEHYVICLDDSVGDVYNALVYDYVIPTTVS